jgi:hypothetical protein
LNQTADGNKKQQTTTSGKQTATEKTQFTEDGGAGRI